MPVPSKPNSAPDETATVPSSVIAPPRLKVPLETDTVPSDVLSKESFNHVVPLLTDSTTIPSLTKLPVLAVPRETLPMALLPSQLSFRRSNTLQTRCGIRCRRFAISARPARCPSHSCSASSRPSSTQENWRCQLPQAVAPRWYSVELPTLVVPVPLISPPVQIKLLLMFKVSEPDLSPAAEYQFPYSDRGARGECDCTAGNIQCANRVKRDS